MIDNVGVVGAGLMGAEIALVSALAGKDVILSDTTQESLDRAVARLGSVLDKGIQRAFFREEQKAEALGRIRTSVDLAAHADRDLVIEAVFENEDVKAAVFRQLDAVCRPDVYIASNTSTISITTPRSVA